MRKLCVGVGMALAVSACGNPMRDVPRLADVQLAADAGQVDVMAPDATSAAGGTLPAVAVSAPQTPRRGLLGFLKQKADAASAPAVTTVRSSGEPPEPMTELDGPDALGAGAVTSAEATRATGAIAATDAPETTGVAAADVPAQGGRGLFGFLRGGTAAAATEETAQGVGSDQVAGGADLGADPGADPADGGVADVQLAVAVLPEDTPAPRVRRGLFGGGRSASDGSSGRTTGSRSGAAPKPGAVDFREVAFGTTIPYGEIARVCGVSDASLGAKSQSWPERGQGYTLRDSAPGSTGAHTFYLTGFQDGCARQFTAALVMFGSPETWEQIHYGPAGSSLPVLTTDRAFEDIKSRVCRVGKGKSCGGRMAALERDTVFVSFYERFEDNTRWTNILLHDGEVVAMDGKK